MSLQRWSIFRKPVLIFLTILPLSGALGYFADFRESTPVERTFSVIANRYSYDPGIMRIRRGDQVRLMFSSADVVHGFYLEGYDLDVTIYPKRTHVEVRRPSQGPDVELAEEVTFTADRIGKFRYRCSKTCGVMHPFMVGEMIVGPNLLLSVGIAMSIGILIAGFLSVLAIGSEPPSVPVKR
jgi:heme/copper-type cytochrome/quinol oxidase subunit 2